MRGLLRPLFRIRAGIVERQFVGRSRIGDATARRAIETVLDVFELWETRHARRQQEEAVEMLRQIRRDLEEVLGEERAVNQTPEPHVPGWRWLKVAGVRCDECSHCHTGQPAPGSDHESHCDHPDRGSSASIPEPCEPDPDGFDPSEKNPHDEDAYVPSWCGRLPKPDMPCMMCQGPSEKRDDVCASCAAWLDQQRTEEL